MVVMSIEPVLKLCYVSFYFSVQQTFLKWRFMAGKTFHRRLWWNRLDRRGIKEDVQSPNRFDMVWSRKTGRRNL
ncbi:hypothetical protein CO654_21015 [Rhizobium sp. L18]|nr:hypothetical protein CO654_21015 [Rhizobium sp. L18]